MMIFKPHRPQTTCLGNGKEPQELDSSVKTEGQKLGRVAVNHDKNKNKTRRSPVAYLQLSLATSTLTKGNWSLTSWSPSSSGESRPLTLEQSNWSIAENRAHIITERSYSRQIKISRQAYNRATLKTSSQSRPTTRRLAPDYPTRSRTSNRRQENFQRPLHDSWIKLLLYSTCFTM